jgi:cytochrome c-type biogenesis protein CcmH/NrfF
MRATALALTALALCAALLPTAAVAATARASLPDIEDEVMCPICGTLLELSDSPQANRERAYIRDQIVAGKTKAQIKDALVAQYGEEVLATPQGSGFDLTAYLIPILAAIVAVVSLFFGVRRWRRAEPAPEPQAAAPSGEDAERLDSDLARYDL